MAANAPITPATTDATLIPTSLVERAVSLQSTATYIDTLLEIVGSTLNDLGGFARRHGDSTAGVADWRQMEILLNLASEQAAIVMDVARAVERADLSVMRTTHNA